MGEVRRKPFLDEFPHMDEARNLSDRDTIAVTVVRSDMAVRVTSGCAIVDAAIFPDGSLALINSDGEMVGSLAQRMIGMFTEAC